LGALSVQATQPDAFDETAIAALQNMADQVSVALDNARLYSESQEALETARRAYRDIGRKEWADLIRRRPDLGFRIDEGGSIAIDPDEEWRPETQLAYRSGKIVTRESEHNEHDYATEPDGRRPLVVPIQAHGEVIGVVETFKNGQNGDWTPDEIEVIQDITAQLALALDNARLHQDTQLRALRQQLAREITEKVRAAPDVESIAATATEELVKALGGSRSFIKLRTQAADNPSGDGPNGRQDPAGG
jgi:GAF domain-containing protein